MARDLAGSICESHTSTGEKKRAFSQNQRRNMKPDIQHGAGTAEWIFADCAKEATLVTFPRYVELTLGQRKCAADRFSKTPRTRMHPPSNPIQMSSQEQTAQTPQGDRRDQRWRRLCQLLRAHGQAASFRLI